ncbi:MAG: fused MFS/spermidine synthase [Gammaproteobacteria bacterium]|nr:fused MFS/spermidine synthase [Gammaproteobacteria bacterium]
MTPDPQPASLPSRFVHPPRRTEGTVATQAGLKLTLPVLLLALLSGVAGLGYEMVWTRMLSVALGHEIGSVLAVIAAFFSGLALGAWSLDGVIRRSRAPAAWYTAVELVIGFWALALVFLVPGFNRLVAELMGPQPSAPWQWICAFASTLLLLLPATFAMGATLPALQRLLSGPGNNRRGVAALYAANTLGAVAGTLLGTFVLAPALGYSRTLLVLFAVNALCAAIGFLMARADRSAPLLRTDRSTPRASGRQAAAIEGVGRTRFMLILFMTGLLGIGYEVLVIRVLSQILENTVYTFACLLSVYLLGTAVGAAVYRAFGIIRGRGARHRADTGHTDFAATLGTLLCVTALAALAGVALLWLAAPLHTTVLGWSGHTYLGAIAAELAVALSIFLLPTLLMGATFAHLGEGATERFGLGRALGLNTFGAALAPALFGVIVLPMTGSKTALLLVCLAYLLLVPTIGRRQIGIGIAVAATAGCLLVVPGALRFVTLPAGGRLLDYNEGVMASVAVVQDRDEHRHLKINNRFTMGGTATTFSDRRQAHIPLLLHPAPRDALFLGLATGSTFVASATHPGLKATAVELIPETLPLLHHFGPSLRTLRENPRFQVLSADARRFVRSSPERYDVIIAEVFHPSRDGAGALYTTEHFEAVRARLREGGLFCQWLPVFQLDLETLGIILRTFTDVFPDGQAWLAHFTLRQPLLALISHPEGIEYHPGWLDTRVEDPTLRRELTSLRLRSDFDLFGNFLASGAALRVVADELDPDLRPNTDDHPVVIYKAPDFSYRPQAAPAVRLLALVDALRASPVDLLGAAADPRTSDFHRRLADYWRARNAFLHAGVDVRPSHDLQVMLEQTREPLLAVVRQSADFDPAYMPLLGMANLLAAKDPAAARDLLLDLKRAGPSRPEAAALMRRLSP